MGLTKPIEQYLFSNLLIRIHVFMYLKDIIRGGIFMNPMKEFRDHLISQGAALVGIGDLTT